MYLVLQKSTLHDFIAATCRYLVQVIKEVFLPRHMGGSLVNRLSVISMSVSRGRYSTGARPGLEPLLSLCMENGPRTLFDFGDRLTI